MFVERLVDSLGTCVLTVIFRCYYSFHNKLKCNPAYLNCRVNKRVDYLITVLLRIEEDMFFDRQRKDLQWKRNRREEREESRHDSGKTFSAKDIKVESMYMHMYYADMN